MTHGLLFPEERKPGSGQVPPAQQAALPALFFFSLSQERVAGGAFPQEEKAPGLLIPQSRGGSGPEAPGTGSTVLPREIREWARRGPGVLLGLVGRGSKPCCSRADCGQRGSSQYWTKALLGGGVRVHTPHSRNGAQAGVFAS